MVQLVGSTTVKVMVHAHPSGQVAVTVEVPAVGPAVKVVFVPDAGLTLPPPATVQLAAAAGATVIVTSSPTPTLVRARLAGEVANVSDVRVHFFGGVGFGFSGHEAVLPGGQSAAGPADGGDDLLGSDEAIGQLRSS